MVIHRSTPQESATFDLTLRIPTELIAQSRKVGQLINVPLPEGSISMYDTVLVHIHKLLRELWVRLSRIHDASLTHCIGIQLTHLLDEQLES